MARYEVRNLVLAIVDDDWDKVDALSIGLVDLLAFPPLSENLCISSLEVHCRNAAREKLLRFDLASIDMNFQEDIDDPMRPLRASGEEAESGTETGRGVADPEIMTASGIYHGMALLARRRGLDEGLNDLPLAWEVRSAAPNAFSGRADLLRDAVRGFALLRALLARPEDGESFEDCIKREHALARPSDEKLSGSPLFKVVEADLLAQNPSEGHIKEILEKLLPRWRRLFRAAVDQRDVILHIPEMERQLGSLERLHAGPGNPNLRTDESLCIPLRGVARAEFSSAIALRSVMADLVARGRINIAVETPLLGVGSKKKLSVLDWYKGLLELARLRESWAARFREIRKRFEHTIQDGETAAVAALWRDCQGVQGDNNRFFLYLLMRVRHWMKAREDNPAGRDPRDRAVFPAPSLSSIYGLQNEENVNGATEQTYRRPAAQNRILRSTPRKLRNGLRSALLYRSGILVDTGVWNSWLADELRAYCLDPHQEGGLQLLKPTVAMRAPGLNR